MVKKRINEKAERAKEIRKQMHWGHRPGIEAVGRKKDVARAFSTEYPDQWFVHQSSKYKPNLEGDYHSHMLDTAYSLWKNSDSYSDKQIEKLLHNLGEYRKPNYLGSGPATELSKQAALDYTDLALMLLRDKIKSTKSSRQDRVYLKKVEYIKQMRRDINAHWDEIVDSSHGRRTKHSDITSKLSGVVAIVGIVIALVFFSGITGNVVGMKTNNIIGAVFILVALVCGGFWLWKRK